MRLFVEDAAEGDIVPVGGVVKGADADAAVGKSFVRLARAVVAWLRIPGPRSQVRSWSDFYNLNSGREKLLVRLLTFASLGAAVT